MSNKIILLLTVLLNFNLIRAEIIREMDIPNLNVAQTLGKWYLVLGPAEDRDMACMSLIVEQLSDDSVRLTANITVTPEGVKRNRNFANEPVLAPMSCTMVENSNILNCSNAKGFSMGIVVFDINYDSYMAVDITNTIDQITTGNSGFISVLGREQTLPNEIIDKVKESNFYRQIGFCNYKVFSPIASCR